ncbi:MAG: hypothetical protein LQ343_007034 [Gyalolechia ehrenbergii]|nr:MAG: hypothetical protein LQ343_007034 [Gyalolechia ehrenbergii]
MGAIKNFFRGILSLCDPDAAGKRKEKPRISAPMGDVKYDPKPSQYDPKLPPPVFSLTHYPYQPGKKFDSYGDAFVPKSIAMPRNHPLRPRLTSSLYSRPSDGGDTYIQRAHPRRPTSSVYSRPTDGSAYSSWRTVGLPAGYTSQMSLSTHTTDSDREFKRQIEAANDLQAGRPPWTILTAEEEAMAQREREEMQKKLLPFLETDEDILRILSSPTSSPP